MKTVSKTGRTVCGENEIHIVALAAACDTYDTSEFGDFADIARLMIHAVMHLLYTEVYLKCGGNVSKMCKTYNSNKHQRQSGFIIFGKSLCDLHMEINDTGQ